MKTSIVISGQISGNFTLRNAIITTECEEKKKMFNGIELVFSTKKAARKALWEGFKSLKANEPEIVGQFGGIRYAAGSALYYDASSAQIVTE